MTHVAYTPADVNQPMNLTNAGATSTTIMWDGGNSRVLTMRQQSAAPGANASLQWISVDLKARSIVGAGIDEVGQEEW